VLAEAVVVALEEPMLVPLQMRVQPTLVVAVAVVAITVLF
jgi:hypothetical protein